MLLWYTHYEEINYTVTIQG